MAFRQWMGALNVFVSHVCRRWDLPLCAKAEEHDEESPSKKSLFSTERQSEERLFFRGDVPEANELLESIAPQIDWARPDKCF